MRPRLEFTRDARLRACAFESTRAWFVSQRDLLLNQQVEIASVPAPTAYEARRADLVASRLAVATGAPVVRDEVGNVIARVPFASDQRACAPVVVVAHLDTVFADGVLPAARREATRVSLPGIGDNARGLGALVAIGAALRRPDVRAQLHRPVELVATVGEEGLGNLRGAKHYFGARNARGVATAAVVAIDGPGDSLIVHHGIASCRMRIVFDGLGGHPWSDAHHPNATTALGFALHSLASEVPSRTGQYTTTVTRVGGGESLTSIPAQAWFDVDVRTLDAKALPTLIARVLRVAAQAAGDASTATDTIRASHSVLGERPGGVLAVDHPLVQVAIGATVECGREPRSASASSDANVPLSYGIPAIAIGAGGTGGGAHTIDEWYDDLDGPRGLARALNIVVGATQIAAD